MTGSREHLVIESVNVDWAARSGIVNHVREKEREVYFTEMEFESHSGKPEGQGGKSVL